VARALLLALFMMSSSALRTLPLLSLLMPLVGCSAGDEGGSERLGEAEEAICPAGAVVYGVDVSVYQGSINWGAVKAAGKDFAICRISDGTGTNDTTFAANWAGIKNAGMVRGAYQFFEPGEDPTAQANLVISKVGVLGNGDLPVVADVEVSGGQSAATLNAHLQTWLNAVEAGTGKRPMIYTSPGLWSSLSGSSGFGGYPLWVANWGVTCPSLPTGWSSFKFWQYSDAGSVSGIPATVDLDEFNGNLAALQAAAGGGPDWAAQYVSQSWPLATTTMQMTVNQQIPASITLKNIGQKTWDTNTKLGTTQPRDRSSPFVGPDWLAPNRLSHVTGTVPPGGTFDFKFTFQAPDAPGMYDEFYGMVEEGVHWFSDPGQGGPPDNDIEAKIQVVEAQYHGQFVSQTYPTLQQPAIMMTTGQTMMGTITLKNVGTATWKAGETKLAPTPRDKPSPLAGSAWLSPTRVSSPPMDVAPGSSYDFPLQLTAGPAGDYTQTFSLVEETITWFADAPKGGGPPDNLLAVHVIVDGAAGTGGSGAGGGGAGGSGAGANGSGANGTTSIGGSVSGHCSCRTAGDERGTGAGWLAVAGLCAAVARRRRR
jgi:lysozyme